MSKPLQKKATAEYPVLHFYGAHNQSRTDDLILTKDALCLLSYVGSSGANPHGKPDIISLYASSIRRQSGAGNETRTRNFHLGRVTLYQLSYSRPPKTLTRTRERHFKQQTGKIQHTMNNVNGKNRNFLLSRSFHLVLRRRASVGSLTLLRMYLKKKQALRLIIRGNTLCMNLGWLLYTG